MSRTKKTDRPETPGRARTAATLRRIAESLRDQAVKLGQEAAHLDDPIILRTQAELAETSEKLWGTSVRVSIGISAFRETPGQAPPELPLIAVAEANAAKAEGTSLLSLPLSEMTLRRLEAEGITTLEALQAADLASLDELTETSEYEIRRALGRPTNGRRTMTKRPGDAIIEPLEQFKESQPGYTEALEQYSAKVAAGQIAEPPGNREWVNASQEAHPTPSPPKAATDRNPAVCRVCGTVDFIGDHPVDWAEEDLCSDCAQAPDDDVPASYGRGEELAIGDEADDQYPDADDPRYESTAQVEQQAERSREVREELKVRELRLAPSNSSPRPWRKRPLISLSLYVKTYQRLTAAGIETIGDLADTDLSTVKDLNADDKREIRRELAALADESIPREYIVAIDGPRDPGTVSPEPRDADPIVAGYDKAMAEGIVGAGGKRLFDVFVKTSDGRRRTTSIKAVDQAEADRRVAELPNPNGHEYFALPRVKAKATA